MILFHGENLLIKDSKNTDTDDLFEKINKLDIKNYYNTVTRPWGWFKTCLLMIIIMLKKYVLIQIETITKATKNVKSWLVMWDHIVLRDNKTYIPKE